MFSSNRSEIRGVIEPFSNYDGRYDGGYLQPDRFITHDDKPVKINLKAAIKKEADLAKAEGIDIYVVNIGNITEAKELGQLVATNGHYYSTDENGLKNIMGKTIVNDINDKVMGSSETIAAGNSFVINDKKQDYFDFVEEQAMAVGSQTNNLVALNEGSNNITWNIGNIDTIEGAIDNDEKVTDSQVRGQNTDVKFAKLVYILKVNRDINGITPKSDLGYLIDRLDRNGISQSKLIYTDLSGKSVEKIFNNVYAKPLYKVNYSLELQDSAGKKITNETTINLVKGKGNFILKAEKVENPSRETTFTNNLQVGNVIPTVDNLNDEAIKLSLTRPDISNYDVLLL